MELVPIGRGGERRAISLGNPGLPGDPYTTPTLWAAIQYPKRRRRIPIFMVAKGFRQSAQTVHSS